MTLSLELLLPEDWEELDRLFRSNKERQPSNVFPIPDKELVDLFTELLLYDILFHGLEGESPCSMNVPCEHALSFFKRRHISEDDIRYLWEKFSGRPGLVEKALDKVHLRQKERDKKDRVWAEKAPLREARNKGIEEVAQLIEHSGNKVFHGRQFPCANWLRDFTEYIRCLKTTEDAT